MKILVDKLTGLIFCSGEFSLTEDRLLTPNYIDRSTTTATAYELEVSTIPWDFQDGRYKLVGGEFLYASPQVEAERLRELQEEKCDTVDRLRISKTYTDVEVAFPTGNKLIQFRDEFDRANLSNVAQAAQLLVMSGQGDSILPYRTQDNVTQYPTAAQMLAIAGEVMDAKQAIVSKAWEHKDNIRGMTTIAGVRDYNVSDGW